jgi:hypothetical protein
MKFPANNWTLAILGILLLLAAFIPQWVMATVPDMTEVRDAGMSGVLIAGILAMAKMILGNRSD